MISLKQPSYSVSILARLVVMKLTRMLLIAPSLDPGAWLLKVLDLARTAGCPDKTHQA